MTAPNEVHNDSLKRKRSDDIIPQNDENKKARQSLTSNKLSDGVIIIDDMSNDEKQKVVLDEKFPAQEKQGNSSDDAGSFSGDDELEDDNDDYTAIIKDELKAEAEELAQSETFLLNNPTAADNGHLKTEVTQLANEDVDMIEPESSAQDRVEKTTKTQNVELEQEPPLQDLSNEILYRKLSLYNPRKWYNYLNCPDPVFAIARFAICQDTKMMLHKNEKVDHGDIWMLMKKESDNIQGIPWLPDQIDSDDFLRACFRLGSCIDPKLLSVLLGGGYRSPQYCEYLLTAFMGLIKNAWKRSCQIGQEIKGIGDNHTEVDVSKDPSDLDDNDADDDADDDNNDDGPAEKTNAKEKDQTEEHETIDNLENESEEDDKTDIVSGINNGKDPTQGVRFSTMSKEIKRFLEGSSYILRTYLNNVSGKRVYNFQDFQKHCQRHGVEFIEEISHGKYEHPRGRLKWLTQKELAPDLNEQTVTSDTHWKSWINAETNFSSKSLSRCALIQFDRLLDWLNYVSEETSGQRETEDHLTPHKPVVSIAPIPLLYLADRAVNFALKVLAEGKEYAEERDEINPAITIQDLHQGYEALHRTDREATLAIRTFYESGFGAPEWFACVEDIWPRVRMRPYSESINVKLCERSPASSISIPKNVMNEMHSIVHVYGLEHRSNVRLLTHRKYRARSGRDFHGGARKQNLRVERESIRAKQADPNYVMSLREELIMYFSKTSAVEQFSQDNKEFINQLPRNSGGNTKMTDETKSLRSKSLSELLKETEQSRTYCNLSLSIDVRRLGWICLHALGEIAETHITDAFHPLGYGSTVNYTNFGDLTKKGRQVTLDSITFSFLASLVDTYVRHEAELLMSCAQHDDGRPWIDRADVALITSLRKEPFLYNDSL